MNYEKEQQVALAAVVMAAQLCQNVRRQPDFSTLTKADRSPVTLADLGAQALVCQHLLAAFPQDPIVGEESADILQKPENASLLRDVTDFVKPFLPQATATAVIDWINGGNAQLGPRYWTLDPIDGTKGFIRGDQYAIALALIEEGQIKLGAIAAPALPMALNQLNPEIGVVFMAVAGGGSQIRPLSGGAFQRIQTRPVTDITQVQPIESLESTHSDRPRQQALAAHLDIQRTPVALDSLAKYGIIARGEADLFLRIPLAQYAANYRENIWDHAAGAIVLAEAGGQVTDLDGKPLDFTIGPKLSQNRGIVATCGSIHQQVIAALAELGI
ncbi:MAG: 3'(2'),5'-bisphosphate nucleotidase [Chloroflexaceae bacterium]|nr:3'(2'),5'-bisphosphate nucleotidase [Chloroflexaceae bacterium]